MKEIKLKGGGLASLLLAVALTMSLTPCVAFAEGTTDATGGGASGAADPAPTNQPAENVVAKIGDTEYATLQAAVDEAAKSGNATIVLQRNIEAWFFISIATTLRWR